MSLAFCNGMRFLLAVFLLCLWGDLTPAVARPGIKTKVARFFRVGSRARPKPWNTRIRQKARPRFHLVSEGLREKLPQKTRHNVSATGWFRTSAGTGTAFLVSNIARDGTALVMTNEHVTGSTTKATITFTSKNGDVLVAKMVRNLAFSKQEDASLVEVRFPKPALLSRNTLRPVKISRRDLQANEKVYTTGFSNLTTVVDQGSRDMISAHFGHERGNQSRNNKINRAIRQRMQTIQTGYENSGTSSKDLAPTEPKLVDGVERRSYLLHIPGTGGASGSPVFSANSDELVALYYGGSINVAKRRKYAVPISQVLLGLKKAYKVPLGQKKAVAKLVSNLFP